MWPEFKTEKSFDPPVFTTSDVSMVSLVFGFTLGFSYFVGLHAFRLTKRIKRLNMFILLVWLEIAGSFVYGLVSILYVNSVIPHSFWIYFAILVAWIFQLQCLVQIIVNRICLLVQNPSHRCWLKLSMVVWIGLINLGVALVWIPAQLQINAKYMEVNIIFDRLEKSLYLVTDAALNYYFIYVVQRRLVASGLKKYDKLVSFNKMIIWVSLAMDVMIIAMMSLKNAFLYTIFHPLAYMVKLEIEMTMSNLIVAVAVGTGVVVDEFHTESTGPSTMRRATETQPVRVTVHTEAITEHDDMPHTAVFADHSLDVKSSPGDEMQMTPIRLPKEQAESIRDSHSSV